jgi:2-polyprenyl-3-methyl-5-hydroxy-6-metoxy-1,4-benzoquinol methylase
MYKDISEKVYDNEGNADVVALVPESARSVLDVGCGAGSNAALLRRRDPEKRIYGITGSASEAERARQHMVQCWVADLEAPLPAELTALRFDCIMLSHVLEHLRDPAALLGRLVSQLEPGGRCVIAVPNVMNWRERTQFLAGKFEYQKDGTLDETHLRFFTYFTAPKLLLTASPELRVLRTSVTGSVPLWVMRRSVLPTVVSQKIDALGCQLWPNLFGSQILIEAERS